jgi:hypothetical protein
VARAQAQQAEQRASAAEQTHQVEQASYEDKVREADRLDPDVDTKSADYEPDVWNDQRSEEAARDTTGETPRTDPAATDANTVRSTSTEQASTASNATTTTSESSAPKHAAPEDDTTAGR